MIHGTENGLPPPFKKGRKGPEMMPEDPSIYGKLSKIAQGGSEEGGMGGGGGGEQEASQHLMNGIQEFMAAAKSHPPLGQVIMPFLQQLRDSLGGMAGDQGPEMGMEPTKKRKRPPKRESGNNDNFNDEENQGY